MRKRGLCLKNAKEYGNKLPVELKKHTVLCVKKEEAKQFKLCKKCLVMIH
jgi:ribosomal protein L7/L12